MLRKFNTQKMNWKLINFRTVSNLMTAEFLHDLYNRHSYEVNSIRFRNTLCILNGSDFRSYAPQNEWELLENELGERFLERDPILIEELSLYIKKDKRRLKSYLKGITSHLENLSPKETYQILVHLHFLALGEIYGINLVQMEHALSWAISKHLKGNPRDFSVVPQFNWESQQKKMEKSIVLGSLRITEDGEDFTDVFNDIFDSYGHFKNAYGTGEDCREDIKAQLLSLLSLSKEERKRKYNSFCSQANPFINENYADLYSLASEVGELRDSNKLLMGKVSGIRKALIAHLGCSLHIQPEEIKWYSLGEIADLVRHGTHLTQEEIDERKNLVIFKREEGFCAGNQTEGIYRAFLGDVRKSSTHCSSMQGIIASKGKITGKARLVYTAADCQSIHEGDIMIAHGTDFDLLSGINKASGIVTEEGGILSHASIVARELQKPCLIHVLGAMSIINNGDLIQLDCETGTLTILDGPSAVYNSEIELLDHIDPAEFTTKINNLHQLKKSGYNVLPGLCIHATNNNFDAGFFEALKNKIRHYLKTDKIIIRQCTGWEDAHDRSFAGISSSRVTGTDLQNLKKTFLDVVNTKPLYNVYHDEPLEAKLDLLIQPFITFEFGGITFIQTDSMGNKHAMVEGSDQGPYQAVNGKSSFRFSARIEDLQQEQFNQAPQFTRDSVDISLKIANELDSDIDIEWGLFEGKLWILQARPVTVPCAL